METPQENSDDKGEWLHIRVRYRKTSVPVRISRRALEEHFGAVGGQHTPIFLYVNNKQSIHRAAHAKLESGWRYTAESPLELRASDFASILGTPGAKKKSWRPEDLQHALDQVSTEQPSESAIGNYVRWRVEAGRVEMVGIFSAEQLERIATFMRRALKDPPDAPSHDEEKHGG
ncbi:hypothetical protein J2W34_004259 [Variovorax boronicumulans]|uniref:hypothetical protein n=1 Tax=Variovorax TaxID=34072 RepID=UPI002786C5A2|nr:MULTISPECIES: hypothetical protein [Variovorax]MDQ0072454.1 hypothetical protein [Variovorax boronicumulans]MDQ0608280.1 hypothetical protein [Variovorax sp. W1I1]